MNKKEIRAQNPSSVMFCHEGSFFTFYDIDALIVNKLCGYKIIPVGRRPKAGVPLKNTIIFQKLEAENIPYIVFKNGEGIIRKFKPEQSSYKKLVSEVEIELTRNGNTIEHYFPPAEKTLTKSETTSTVESESLSRLTTLITGKDPFTLQPTNISTDTISWLGELQVAVTSLLKAVCTK